MKKKRVVRPKGRKTAKPVRKVTPAPKTRALVKSTKRRAIGPSLLQEPAAIAANDARTITGDGLNVGALGLVELKLTEAEEKVLAEPLPKHEVLFRAKKKDGPKDTPYLPHTSYTRWFNRAFGRTGWQMVPISKPMMVESAKTKGNLLAITCHYVLHVHGKPIAYAMGEQKYHETNDGQSYGDAFESTMASALRRCAKRLGIGLELWDKNWVQQNLLRRSSDDGARQQPRGKRRQSAEAEQFNPDDDRPITDGIATDGSGRVGQRQRLWQIIRNSNRADTEVMMWLKERFNVDRLVEIKRKDYDYICKQIEAPGDLPMPEDVDGDDAIEADFERED